MVVSMYCHVKEMYGFLMFKVH